MTWKRNTKRNGSAGGKGVPAPAGGSLATRTGTHGSETKHNRRSNRMSLVFFFCLWILLIVSYLSARLFFTPVHDDARSVLGFNLFSLSAFPLKGRGNGRGVGLAPLPLSKILEVLDKDSTQTFFSGHTKKSKRVI